MEREVRLSRTKSILVNTMHLWGEPELLSGACKHIHKCTYTHAHNYILCMEQTCHAACSLLNEKFLRTSDWLTKSHGNGVTKQQRTRTAIWLVKSGAEFSIKVVLLCF